MNINLNAMFSECLVPYAAGFLLTPVFSYLHEYGHAAARKLIYRNAYSVISVSWNGGETHTYYEGNPEYSSIARTLGVKGSEFLASAAGPMAEIISAVAIEVLSSSPKRHAFILAGCLLDNSIYALSAFSNSPLEAGHDFGKMKQICPMGNRVLTILILGGAATVLLKASSTFIEY